MTGADADALIAAVRIPPGAEAKLASRDPGDALGLESKAQGQEIVDGLRDELVSLHDKLWAEAERSVLLVLQGIDASGKDGAIRKVLSGINPQGCHVVGFKAPSDEEKAWRDLWADFEDLLSLIE